MGDKKLEENIIMHFNENKELISSLSKQIDLLNIKIKNQEKVLDSYNSLFTYLYVFHDINPKGILKDMQDLCLELLRFIDNVCTKHKISYWLDFGTLLGSIRHGGFIPWDDDVDIAILNNDLNKFLDVLKLEIINNDLDEFITILEKKKYDSDITGFVQILYFKSPLVNNMLAGVDVLPHEFLKDDENLSIDELRDNISHKVKSIRKEFSENEYFKKCPDEANKKFNETLSIVESKEKYMIASAVNINPSRVRLYKTNDIFPLKKVKFEQYSFLSVNNEKNYLETVFGKDYMELPKILSFHTRMQTLMKKDVEDLHGLYQGEIRKLRKINEKWM